MKKTVELFTLRLWQEATGGDKIEWRGKVQHIRSGETRYFRDWPTLVQFLREAAHKLEDSDMGSSNRPGEQLGSGNKAQARTGTQGKGRSDDSALYTLGCQAAEVLETFVARLLDWGDRWTSYLIWRLIMLLLPEPTRLAFVEI